MKKLFLSLMFVLLFAVSAIAAMININTADVATLKTLPGIGEAKAIAIVEYRTQHGSFKTLEDLQNVKGIGPKVLEKLRDKISLEN